MLIETLKIGIKEKKLICYRRQSFDIQTANIMLKVYEALNLKGKKNFLILSKKNMPLLIEKCWRCAE